MLAAVLPHSDNQTNKSNLEMLHNGESTTAAVLPQDQAHEISLCAVCYTTDLHDARAHLLGIVTYCTGDPPALEVNQQCPQNTETSIILA